MIQYIRYLAPRDMGGGWLSLPSLPDGLAQYHPLVLWQSPQCYETGYPTAYWRKVYCS